MLLFSRSVSLGYSSTYCYRIRWLVVKNVSHGMLAVLCYSSKNMAANILINEVSMFNVFL